MTLLELRTDIDARYPSTFTNEQKNGWVNEGMEILASEIGEIDTALFETTEGTAIYKMLDDMRMENIKSLLVGDVPYDAAGQNTELVRPSYMLATERYFALYPEPSKTGIVITVTYQKQPPPVSEDDDEIKLRTKYIPALKYYVMGIIAEANDDINKANNMYSQYNAELVRIKMDKYKHNGKYPVTRDVMDLSGRIRRVTRTKRR